MSNIIDVKQIHAADLYNYSIQLAEAVLEGWQVSDLSEYIPMQLGYTYLANLVKYEEEAEKATSVAKEETEPKAPSAQQLMKEELLAQYPDQAGKAQEEAKAAEPVRRGPKPKGK